MVTVFQNVFSQVWVERGLGQAAATALIRRADSSSADYVAVPRVQANDSLRIFDPNVAAHVVVDMIDLRVGETTQIRGSREDGFTMSATESAATALEDALAEIQARLIEYHRGRR